MSVPKHLREIWAVVSILVVAGLVFLAGGALIPHWLDPLGYLMESIGIASITAAVLAVSVDFALKTRLARDAFEAAFGHILPDELKPELKAIYGIRIVCTQHQQQCELTRDGSAISVRTIIRRTLKNITDTTQEQPIGLAIDEWFSPVGKSRILSLGYTKNNKEVKLIEKGEMVDVETKVRMETYAWIAEAKAVMLDADEELMTWSEFVETKQLNDTMYMFFSVPTIRPEVMVDIRDDSGQTFANASFAHRKASEAINRGLSTFVLPGMLLTFQPIQVRWWNKEALKQ